MAYALSKAEAVCKEIQVRENIKKNQAAFSANDQTSPWRDNLLSPNAVMGGVRNMEKPVVLYKAASKRVTLYSRDTYALELNGVGEFGAYYLSKHIFNLSFLHDPFFRRSNPTKKGRVSRSCTSWEITISIHQKPVQLVYFYDRH